MLDYGAPVLSQNLMSVWALIFLLNKKGCADHVIKQQFLPYCIVAKLYVKHSLLYNGKILC